MRRSRQEAAETRERIVETAAERFRQQGIHATGLADLMAAAGLTHGGFYRHFASKDELVAEACSAAFAGVIGRMGGATARRPAGLAALVARYLSPAHRDAPSTGCPLAALGGEMARADDATRAAATAGLLGLTKLVADGIGGTSADDARASALVAVATMVGAVTLARLVTDSKLSDEILRRARENILAG